MQFAVVKSSAKLTDAEMALMCSAINAQLAEAAAAWNVPAMPCCYYATVEGLPMTDVYVLHVVDDVGDPGALGWHSVTAGLPHGEVLAQDFDGTAVTLSHEALETLIDPLADGWRDRGDGSKVALEVADPVEGDVYLETGDDGAGPRPVSVSNYVLPSWFEPAGAMKYDRMGKLSAPFTMTAGGYMVIEDAQGTDSQVFARRVEHGGEEGRANAERKRRKPNGRLTKRLEEIGT